MKSEISPSPDALVKHARAMNELPQSLPEECTREQREALGEAEQMFGQWAAIQQKRVDLGNAAVGSEDLDPRYVLFRKARPYVNAVKTDTACSDRCADLLGSGTTAALMRSINGISPVDSQLQPFLCGKATLTDFVAERTRMVPTHINGVGLALIAGVPSGIEGHVENTTAATIIGLFQENIGKAATTSFY